MKRSLDKQAEEILKQARKTGLKSNYFFATTFQRYVQQLKMLAELKDAIEEHGPLVEKEYVKGRENVCANPLLAEWAKLNDVSQRTLNSMVDIITKFGKAKPTQSKLGAFMNG